MYNIQINTFLIQFHHLFIQFIQFIQLYHLFHQKSVIIICSYVFNVEAVDQHQKSAEMYILTIVQCVLKVIEIFSTVSAEGSNFIIKAL